MLCNAWYHHNVISLCLHRQPTLLHASIKNQYTATGIYKTTAKYVAATNMPSNARNMAYAQNSWCTFMGEVCQPTYHISHSP